MNQEAINKIGEVLTISCQSSPKTPEEELFEERITPETILPDMEPLFELNGTPCFYRGELVADCGKAKSGKTTLLSIVMAACLKEQALGLKRRTEKPLRVLWIDTEQSQQSTQEIILKRIKPLAGELDYNEWFFAFNLRGLGYKKRKSLVELAINAVKPDLVVIDGIKDLMTDINDASQSSILMERLMKMAKKSNSCIICVLHQNKSEADRNMRGSIGTELTNKAFEVFQCEYLEKYEVFKVSQTYSRHKKMKQKFYYRLNDDGLPVEDRMFREQSRDDNGRWTSDNHFSTEELTKTFSEVMENRTQRPFNEVMAIAFKKCGFTDAKVYYKAVEEAISQGIIRKVNHPDTDVTWIELCDNEIPF